eukprot:scaffold911_cov314-Pavlova_lutheri.AAC.17
MDHLPCLGCHLGAGSTSRVPRAISLSPSYHARFVDPSSSISIKFIPFVVALPPFPAHTSLLRLNSG